MKFIQPLFRGYIFVAFDQALDRWQAVNNTRGIRRLMCFVRDDSIEPIPLPTETEARLRQDCKAPLEDTDPLMAAFKVGERLRILPALSIEEPSPFAGQLVSVTRPSDGEGNVGILLSFLGRQCEIEMPATQLEKV